MLAPELPLKLSAAGIRLTGYMVEKQLRVAQVYCEAFLNTGMWSRTLTAKAAVPAPQPPSRAAPPARPRPRQRRPLL
jgi:hypothetical protein